MPAQTRLLATMAALRSMCPTSGVHLKTLLTDVVPEDHLPPQIMWNMACAQRAWWDFVSYDPRFPDALQFFVKRVMRDDRAIARMEAEARDRARRARRQAPRARRALPSGGVMGLFALIQMWWRQRQRQIDMDMLWPICCAHAPRPPDHAKAAFAVHALHDRAWQALGEEETLRFIDRLEAYR